MEVSRAATFHVAQRHEAADDAGPGTIDRPWKSIARAVSKLEPGDRVVVRSGVYRERVVIQASGAVGAPITVEAAPGERVLLTGADLLVEWRKSEGEAPIYRTPWTHRFVSWNPGMSHPGDAYHQLIGRCEQVWVEGYGLRQVLERGQLAPGTFFADIANGILEAWDFGGRDLSKVTVEGSVRQEILRVEGRHVRVRGLGFRYAANMAQHGAVVLAGDHGALEHCVIEAMNSSGATFSAPNLRVTGCVFRDNGQLGFGASRAHGLRLSGCLVENNNTKAFDRGWEAGGNKLVLCRGAVLEQSRFLRNRGQGIWFDIGNEDCTVRNCLIADNEDGGIFYEISFGLRAHDNVIVGNGFASTRGAWGAQAGISLSSSPGCVIERNLLVGNREGFNFREQQRTTPRIDGKEEEAVWVHDEIVRSNIIAFNRDAQVWGWFDVTDDRHWPSQSRAGSAAAPEGTRPGDLAAPYGGKPGLKAPGGLTLEKLRLRFEGNVYGAGPGQGWFGWGPPWRRHETYADLESFRRLGIDSASVVRNLQFTQAAARDFRLSAGQMREVGAAYPRGDVPGAVLGEE